MGLATGAGISSYFMVKRFRPSLRFPIDTIPPFICFYLTHRAAHVWQMQGMYESFLSIQSPLGVRAREILQAVRSGGRLPSDEFGKQLPVPRPGSAPSAGSSAREPD